MILAGDVGGTKCSLALFDPGKPGKPLEERTLPSREFSGLEEVVAGYLSEESVKPLRRQIVHLCLGIAGPVVGGRVKTPNLPWIVTEANLSQTLGLDVSIINDLVATGYGVLTLKEDQLQSLNEGTQDPSGHLALIAAGTGLGEALIVKTTDGHLPVPSEGGHTDFAPRNKLEMELLTYSLQKWPHVSYERVLSGPGLLNIFNFLKSTGRGKEADWFSARVVSGRDPSAVISEAALNQECSLCLQALELFVSIYGAEAGNLALTAKTTGGVFVGGGIAPKILPKLQDGTFVGAFTDKGRMQPLLSSMPIQVVLESRTALFGAAYYATKQIT